MSLHPPSDSEVLAITVCLSAVCVKLGDTVTIWQWIKFSPWSGVSSSYLPNSVCLAIDPPSSVLTCLPYIWLL